VEDSDQIMLVTNRGQLIRIPVDGISIVGRSTQGVTVFATAKDERVVAVEHIPDVENGDDEGEEDEEDGESEGPIEEAG
jgi:DNA gyrase subunit A